MTLGCQEYETGSQGSSFFKEKSRGCLRRPWGGFFVLKAPIAHWQIICRTALPWGMGCQLRVFRQTPARFSSSQEAIKMG